MTHTLDAAVYWKVRTFFSETQRLAAVAVAARDAVKTAEQRQTALLRELGIDPQATAWQLDDDTCTITTPDAPP
jgi:hypothetical protein